MTPQSVRLKSRVMVDANTGNDTAARLPFGRGLAIEAANGGVLIKPGEQLTGGYRWSMGTKSRSVAPR